MLELNSNAGHRNCDGSTRRDFLKVGMMGMGGMTLAQLMQTKAEAKKQGLQVKDKSVIWIWLSGGPTHVETFDPKMTAPVEYRSLTGEAATPIPGMSFGGTFPMMAAQGDKMAVVRSFAHGNSSHGTATQFVMTGYKDKTPTMKPSIGSIIARAKGTTNPSTGMPTYVSMGRIRNEGPGWLGAAYTAFDPKGESRKNMDLKISSDRVGDRRGLLSELDRLKKNVDRTGMMEGMTGFEKQAFELILGGSKEAFDISKEDSKTRKRYGTKRNGLGDQLLQARRLCEAGCGFVTINYGGWDMHGGIVKGMKGRAGEMDQAISGLIEDLNQRGMADDVLVVVTGEFGRTPKINSKGGRDHWGRLCTLGLSGGGLNMGQVVGESSPKLEVPATTPITPQDLMATILEMYGIGHRVQFIDHQGRPVYLLEDGAPIRELI